MVVHSGPRVEAIDDAVDAVDGDGVSLLQNVQVLDRGLS
jgi:hypothetical protein